MSIFALDFIRLKSHFILMKKLPRWAAACKKPKWYELHLFSSMASVKKLILAEFRCEKATTLRCQLNE